VRAVNLSPLDEVAERVCVGYVGPSSEFFCEDGVPFLRTGNVGKKQLHLNDIKRVTPEFHSKQKKSTLKAGDVLVTRVVSDELKAAIVPPELAGGNCGNIIVVRPGKRLDPNYLMHLLSAPDSQKTLLGRQVGSAQSVINTAVLKSWQIPVLDLEEQRRIAAILDQAETLRTQRRSALALLDSLTQSLFLDMFGDPVTNDRGWPDSLALGEVADIASGVTKGRKLDGKATREVPYLAVANVQDKALRLTGLKTIEATEDEIARYRLQIDDLLLTEGGDPDKLGRGTLWKEELPECIHQNHIFRVRLTHAALHPLFLNWLVGSTRGKNYFLRSAKQTTGIASINMTQLRSFPLLVPPLPLQQAFATRIASIEALKATHRRALDALDALFASLQQRAFEGELVASPAATQYKYIPAHKTVDNLEDLRTLEGALGLEALIFVAKRTAGNDVYAALKTLYIADKQHLEHYGRLIYGETYNALPMGPVPEAAYETIKFLRDPQQMFCSFGDSNVRAALRAEGSKRLTPLRDADLNKLGADAVQSLEAAIRYFANSDFGQVKTATHDSAYERTPPNQRIPVRYIIDMLPAEARQRHWNV